MQIGLISAGLMGARLACNLDCVGKDVFAIDLSAEFMKPRIAAPSNTNMTCFNRNSP
jgi:3-hydroxyacyl-CoA dehydrogenase